MWIGRWPLGVESSNTFIDEGYVSASLRAVTGFNCRTGTDALAAPCGCVKAPTAHVCGTHARKCAPHAILQLLQRAGVVKGR